MGQKQVKMFSYKVYNDLWEYDPDKNTWTQKAEFPGGGRLGAKGFTINGKAYVGFGYFIQPDGPYAGSNNYQPDLYEFDPLENKWTKKNNATFGGKDICFVIHDTAWSVNLEYRSVNRYNILSDEWVEKKWAKKALAPGYKEAIGDDIGFSSEEKGYLVTFVAKKGKSTNQLWEFDPHTVSWVQKKDLPLQGSDSLAVFSAGGKRFALLQGRDLWEYNLASDTWIRQKEVPSRCKYFRPLFSIGEKIYGLNKYEFWELLP